MGTTTQHFTSLQGEKNKRIKCEREARDPYSVALFWLDGLAPQGDGLWVTPAADRLSPGSLSLSGLLLVLPFPFSFFFFFLSFLFSLVFCLKRSWAGAGCYMRNVVYIIQRSYSIAILLYRGQCKYVQLCWYTVLVQCCTCMSPWLWGTINFIASFSKRWSVWMISISIVSVFFSLSMAVNRVPRSVWKYLLWQYWVLSNSTIGVTHRF